jgi:hypothetical protein
MRVKNFVPHRSYSIRPRKEMQPVGKVEHLRVIALLTFPDFALDHSLFGPLQ